MRRFYTQFTAALALFISLSAAPAQTNVSTVDQIKQPFDWLKWGLDVRYRNEYFNNAQTLDSRAAYHEQEYFRYRGRLWTAITPLTDLSLNVRLTTEPRTWFNRASYTPFRGRRGTDWTYGIFDTLNVQWRNALSLPATLTVGRQDIALGDGWLVLEGTPGDGSTTTFLDSARLTCELKDQHTTIEVIGIAQSAQDDNWLPTLNNQDRILVEQNERGAILNVENKSIAAANLCGYFIYKHDERVTSGGDSADIYTLGGRVSGLLDEHWKYSVEGAYQFGEKQDLNIKYPSVSTAYRDIDAYGANSRLTCLFKDRFNQQAYFCYEVLSGDNPNTGRDEMFDILWGRWPRWSEMYNIYGYVGETRVGQTANLHRFGPGYTITPMKNLDFIANYNLLFADTAKPTRAANAAEFNGGNFRGHYLQAILKYKFNRYLSGHLWGEFIFPGDYYANHELMSFLRAEMTMTF